MFQILTGSDFSLIPKTLLKGVLNTLIFSPFPECWNSDTDEKSSVPKQKRGLNFLSKVPFFVIT
jgi:hypothetical protein